MQMTVDTGQNDSAALNKALQGMLSSCPKMCIAGQQVGGGGDRLSIALTSAGGQSFESQSADSEQITWAAQSADAAFGSWAGLSVSDRAKVMRKMADSIAEFTDDIAVLQTHESATPIRQSRDSVRYAAQYLSDLSDLAEELSDTDEVAPGVVVRHDPIGPVAVVSSWNQGFFNIVQAAGNALLSGNPVVIKPSERAPFTAQAFAELAGEAGLPPGVVNMVTGSARTAQVLAENPLITGIHLTGGTEAGQVLGEIAHRSHMPANMELGGKSALIVLEDADLGAAAAQATMGIAMLSGQACAAPTRIFVHNSVRRRFERLYRGFLRRITLGDPFLAETDMGPLISVEARRRIMLTVHAELSKGASLLDPSMEQPLETGDAWLRPIVLSDPPVTSEVARVELFGPVQCLWGYDTVREAIEQANDSDYALAAYVQGGCPDRTQSVAEKLSVGSVWINGVRPLSARMPFGGVGASGSGRLGGVEGLRKFTRTKAYCRGTQA
ncbi:MAG: aldehyde dehydrogenase family protein [Paracoccaceae bacterium]|nr:aldehyde dehydrogenase family protein [Paracoccaceae bacterium]